MTAACNFISLGEEMRELCVRKCVKCVRKITDYMIGQKQGAKFSRCVAVFFGEAE